MQGHHALSTAIEFRSEKGMTSANDLRILSLKLFSRMKQRQAWLFLRVVKAKSEVGKKNL